MNVMNSFSDSIFNKKKFKKQYAIFFKWFKEQKHKEIRDATRQDLD